MKSHGGSRKGAGRPKKDSPLGHLRVLENPKTREPEATGAAVGLGDLRWTRAERRAFLRATGVDYIEAHRRVVDQTWEALLVGLPKMAERGDMGQAWFAYRMITRARYGYLRPSPEILAKLRELLPQAGRALWRISVVNDPKGLYKSTELLRIRRLARTALCKSVGVRITRRLIQVQGREFTRQLMTAIADARPTLTPDQAVVLVAWTDDQEGPRFLQRGIKAGMFRIGK
jgi:hypothetical protein